MIRLSLLLAVAMMASGCTRIYCTRVGGTSEHPEWQEHWLCGPGNELFINEVGFGSKLKKKTDGLNRVRLTFIPLIPITPFVKNVANEYNDGTPIR